jgi:hypothetical protein
MVTRADDRVPTAIADACKNCGLMREVATFIWAGRGGCSPFFIEKVVTSYAKAPMTDDRLQQLLTTIVGMEKATWFISQGVRKFAQPQGGVVSVGCGAWPSWDEVVAEINARMGSTRGHA